jgi:site-specific DNA-methyltransferase (adenine-specific)
MNEWETPQWLYDGLNARFCFTLDPAATHNNTKCTRYYTRMENGLWQSWQGERVFLHPPYDYTIGAWIEKAREEAEYGALVVALIPKFSETIWWKEHVIDHADLRFFSDHLTFANATEPAPYHSAIAVWWGWRSLAGGFVNGES